MKRQPCVACSQHEYDCLAVAGEWLQALQHKLGATPVHSGSFLFWTQEKQQIVARTSSGIFPFVRTTKQQSVRAAQVLNLLKKITRVFPLQEGCNTKK
jgi:hypothetical protein